MAIESTNTVFFSFMFEPEDFASFAESVTPRGSGILYGCEVTITSSNTIHINSGRVVVRGRIIRIYEGSITMTLPSAKCTKYLQMAVNLAADPSTSVSIVDTEGTDSELFNSTNGQAYLRLASFTANSTGLSDVICTPVITVCPTFFGTKKPSEDPLVSNWPNNAVYYSKSGNTITQYVKHSGTWYTVGGGSSSSSSSSSSGSSSSSSGSSSSSSSTTKRIQVVASALNVRKGPSTSYAIIGSLAKGTIRDVLSEQSGWYKVTEGWVYGNNGNYAKVI